MKIRNIINGKIRSRPPKEKGKRMPEEVHSGLVVQGEAGYVGSIHFGSEYAIVKIHVAWVVSRRLRASHMLPHNVSPLRRKDFSRHRMRRDAPRNPLTCSRVDATRTLARLNPPPHFLSFLPLHST